MCFYKKLLTLFTAQLIGMTFLMNIYFIVLTFYKQVLTHKWFMRENELVFG